MLTTADIHDETLAATFTGADLSKINQSVTNITGGQRHNCNIEDCQPPEVDKSAYIRHQNHSVESAVLLGYIKVMRRITDQATPVLRMFFVCVMGRRECQERGKGGKVCSPSASYSDQAVRHGPLVLAYCCLVSSFAFMRVRLEAEAEEKHFTFLST
jgi:hypothetical protein